MSRKRASKQSPSPASAATITTRLNSIMPAVVAVTTAIVLLAVTVPWRPVEEAELDYLDFSWMLVIHDALATAKQFGRQLVFMYGPLGFVVTSIYDPRTYLVLLAVRSLMAIAAFAALWNAAKKFLPHPLAALPWLLTLIVVMGASTDHFFPMCAILLLMSYFIINDRAVNRVVLALTLVLAAASLAKVNLFLQSAVAIGAISLDRVFRRGRFRFAVPLTYAGGLAVFYLAARQRPENLVAFMRTSWQVSAAYVDAVGLPGPFIDALVYLIVSAVVLIMVTDFHWRKQRITGIVPVAALAALLVLLYKHSFVRQDFFHATIGPMVLFGVTVLYLPPVWSLAGGPVRKGIGILALGLAATVGSSSLSTYAGETLIGLAWDTAQHAAGAFAAVGGNVSDPSRLHRKWESARAQLRHDNFVPVSEIRGSVDVYPHRLDVLFAYGLPYNPRPTILSVVATSPALADLNASHLKGTTAPGSVLLDIDLVDQHFPSLLDGRSWPDLLTRYDVVDTPGAFTLLRRTATPRSYQLTPLCMLKCQFDKPVVMPESDAPLWARIQLTPRRTGKIIAALYRAPVLIIKPQTRDATDNINYRLLPALAGQGFLLSPLIKSRGDFANLAKPTWRRELRSVFIDSITISVGDASTETYFDPDFTIELDSLEFPRQNPIPASGAPVK